MSQKYTVKVTLAVIGLNLQNGEYNFLSVDKDTLIMPYQELNAELSISKIIENIAQIYIDLDINWLTSSLISCLENQESNIVILYKCIIPLDTTLKNNACWIPFHKCQHNILISEVMKSI